MVTALELVKSVDSREALHPFLDDKSAKDVLSAWTFQRRAFTDRPLKENETYYEAFDALWLTSQEVDFAQLSNDADVPMLNCKRIFDRLKSARLIFPDGTLSASASMLLRAETGGHISGVIPVSRISRIPPSPSGTPRDQKKKPRASRKTSRRVSRKTARGNNARGRQKLR